MNLPDIINKMANIQTEDQLDEELRGEIEAIAFKSSLDLRDYASQVDNELALLEDNLIQKYITCGPEVAKLHKQVTTCDTILEQMEVILSNFHKDLGTISSEIQDLQSKSTIMNKRLQNRQSVRGELSQFLSDMAIPEQLIRHILTTPVTEQEFLEHLHELDHKINFSLEQSMVDYKSFEDVNVLLKKLKIKAVTKIRDYLLQKIYSLRKPLTNYQIPQNQMLKYRFYNEFLLAHDRETAVEIRTEYVNTMSKVYYAYFKAYYAKLAKLQLDTSAEKDVLLGKKFDEQTSTAGSSMMGAMGLGNLTTSSSNPGLSSGMRMPSQTSGARHGLFGLGERATRVMSKSNIEAPIVLPHVASKAEVKYPFEVLFRSTQFALLDAACREYFFLADFFLLSAGSSSVSPATTPATVRPQSRAQSGAALASLFDLVMGPTLGLVRKQVDTAFIPVVSHDALGMLICLEVLYALLRLTHERSVPVMDKFWTPITETLWVRVTDRLDTHIASLQHEFDVSGFITRVRALTSTGGGGGSTDHGASAAGSVGLPARTCALIRPHAVARRYAELAASLHAIGHGYPGTPLFPDPSNCLNKLKSDDPTSPGQAPRRSSDTSNHSGLDSTLPHQGSMDSLNSLRRVSSNVGAPSSSSPPPPLDARIISRLAQLQVQFEFVLYRLADAFPRPRLKYVFLINNFDLVMSVLTEHGVVDAPEVLRCRDAATRHTTTFIDEALTPYFGSLINFVRDVEGRRGAQSAAAGQSRGHVTQPAGTEEAGQSGTMARNEEARVTRIIKGFNIDWKNSIDKIHGEIMMEFANFTLGTEVFQAVLAQLVQHYHRFQKVMTQSPFKNMPVRNQLVNIHHIMNEIKKCKTTF